MLIQPRLWTPDQGLPDGARAQEYLREERRRHNEVWRHIRDPRISRQLELAITHIAVAQGFRSGAGTTVATAATMGTTVVNDLLCVAGITNGTAGVTLSITDTQANTWFTANPIFTGSTTDRGQSWYAFAKNTTATTPTITSSASTTFAVVLADVFRGTDLTSNVLGPHNETSGSGNPTSGSLALDADDCAIWAWCTDSITAVGLIDGTNGTKGADDTQSDWSEYRILTGRNGQSITAAFTGSGVFTIGTVAWRPPSAGAQPDVVLRDPRTKPGFRDSRRLQGPGFKIFS